MGSLNELRELTELTSMAASGNAEAAAPPRAGNGGSAGAVGIQGIMTNVPAERLSAAKAIEWARCLRTAREAFLPVQIVTHRHHAPHEPVIAWRNHRNLQFLTHWLRCHMHGAWRARGECRPVEEVLRDLQEVHRVTLTVDGVVVRRIASLPSKAVAALLEKLSLWELFETAGK
jgi:hypothetical protein